MTPSEIDTMPAGREMDALVAEKVMGCRIGWYDSYEGGENTTKVRECGCGDHRHDSNTDRVPQGGTLAKYSTEIYDAWEVVEKLGVATIPLDGGGWAATVTSIHAKHGTELYIVPGSDDPCYGWEKADTAPLAICRAALKAVLAW